jgi:hypothetical protein
MPARRVDVAPAAGRGRSSSRNSIERNRKCRDRSLEYALGRLKKGQEIQCLTTWGAFDAEQKEIQRRA